MFHVEHQPANRASPPDTTASPPANPTGSLPSHPPAYIWLYPVWTDSLFCWWVAGLGFRGLKFAGDLATSHQHFLCCFGHGLWLWISVWVSVFLFHRGVYYFWLGDLKVLSGGLTILLRATERSEGGRNNQPICEDQTAQRSMASPHASQPKRCRWP